MIAKGLLLKGGAGLATAAAGGASIYYGLDHLQNQSTKFDQGLINFLNEGGKIKFAVTVGSDTTLSSFPAFADNSTKLTATVKIKTNGANADSEGTLTPAGNAGEGSKGKIEYLRSLNGGGSGTDWTWICEIEFFKDAGSIKDLADDYKNRLVKTDQEKGFFNRLKENGDSDAEKNKEQKIKFIRDCAKARTKEENKKINGLNDLNSMTPANEIKSLMKFKVGVGKSENAGEDTNKLYPENKWEFDSWFPVKKAN